MSVTIRQDDMGWRIDLEGTPIGFASKSTDAKRKNSRIIKLQN